MLSCREQGSASKRKGNGEFSKEIFLYAIMALSYIGNAMKGMADY